MGRKRLPEQEKRIGLKITIKKKYVDQLKESGVNISHLIEEFVKNFLKG